MSKLEETGKGENLKRALKDRHIQMIAIGCAIGTGLFYGSVDTISKSGPSVILGYALVGCLLYFVMRALSEMTVEEPVSGSFSYFANKYVSGYLGFVCGWNYWFNYIAVCMVELSIVGLYMQGFHVFENLPLWASSLIFWAIFFVINLLPVKAYGEMEFWFALIKVVTIVLMLVFGAWLVLFGFGDVKPVGFTNLFANGGFFPKGFGLNGFIGALVIVAFSFGGIELFATTAAEAEDPKKTIPAAVSKIIWRILIFYVGTMLIINALIPWDKISGAGSPFVPVFKTFGFGAAANVINLVVITAALSALNSCIYASSRMMFSLAEQGRAPKAFAKVNSNKTPINAVILSCIMALIVVALNYMFPATVEHGSAVDKSKVFVWCAGIATVAIVINWILIMIIHIYFRKAKDAEGVQLSYKLPFFPQINYIIIALLAGIIIVMVITPENQPALIVFGVWFVLLNIFYFFRKMFTKQ